MKWVVTLSAVAIALALGAMPADGAPSLLGRVKKLEREVSGLTALYVRHDQLRSTTIDAPISWQANYGTGTAFCPPGTTVTGGGVRWTGAVIGIDSTMIASYSTGTGWFAAVRWGAGTTATASVEAICTSIG